MQATLLLLAQAGAPWCRHFSHTWKYVTCFTGFEARFLCIQPKSKLILGCIMNHPSGWLTPQNRNENKTCCSDAKLHLVHLDENPAVDSLGLAVTTK